jgi:Sugar (and other) transporter
VAFLAGPALAFVILIVRRNLPESPRWLITHGREAEAEEAMRRIEEAATRDGQHLEPVPENAVFFAIAQVVGAVGPAFYGVLIGNGTSRTGLAIGYVVGGGIMIIGGLVEIVFGVDAEGKSLEQVAAPLTVVDG